MSVQIEHTTKNDISHVHDMAQRHFIKNLTPDEATMKGFLLSSYSLHDYYDFYNHTEYFFVIKDGNKLAGFLLAFDRGNIPPREYSRNKIIHKDNENYVLVKQVCVDFEFRDMGYGELLYQHLFKLCSECRFYATIPLEPPNSISIDFHQKLGFDLSFEVTDPEGYRRGVYLLELEEKTV